jgi:hypothetical protein
MHRRFPVPEAVAAAGTAREPHSAGERPERAARRIEDELEAAASIDRRSAWPTHRIRCFLRSQAKLP